MSDDPYDSEDNVPHNRNNPFDQRESDLVYKERQITINTIQEANSRLEDQSQADSPAGVMDNTNF